MGQTELKTNLICYIVITSLNAHLIWFSFVFFYIYLSVLQLLCLWVACAIFFLCTMHVKKVFSVQQWWFMICTIWLTTQGSIWSVLALSSVPLVSISYFVMVHLPLCSLSFISVSSSFSFQDLLPPNTPLISHTWVSCYSSTLPVAKMFLFPHLTPRLSVHQCLFYPEEKCISNSIHCIIFFWVINYCFFVFVFPPPKPVISFCLFNFYFFLSSK